MRLLRLSTASGALIIGFCLPGFLPVTSAQSFQEDTNASTPRALKNLSLEELSEIEVTTVLKGPEKALRSAAAVYVITGDDIQRSGATTIPEVLRLAPGVEVARIEGGKYSIGVRGFGSRFSRSVLVMVDGRTVYTTVFAGTFWEVQDTLLDDIDRIEVIRGPGGTIWGPNAVNGVINIITKSSKDTQGTLFSAAAGNEDQGMLKFRYGGGNGKNVSYRVYGKSFTRSPQVHDDGRNFDDWRGAQAGFRVDWEKNERDTLIFQGDLYGQELGQRAQVISYSQPFSRLVESSATLSGGNVMARWKRTIRDGQDLQLQTFYERTNRNESAGIAGGYRDTYDADFLHRFRLAAHHEISWGVGARVSGGEVTPIVSRIFDPARRTDHLLTAFLQDEIGLVEDRLSLILGTKLLNTNFAGLAVEPSARLLWTPTNRQSFWTAFTRAVRTPSSVERDLIAAAFRNITPAGVPLFVRFTPNREFASETLNGYEFGYRQLIGKKWLVDTAAFYNRYHDLLSQEITGPAFVETTPQPVHFVLPGQLRNGLLGATAGFEISPEWRPTNIWRLRGNYSYLNIDLKKAADSLDMGTSPVIEGSSPNHQATVHSAIDLSKSLQADLMYRYVSALPGQGVPAYHTGDARLAWRFSRQLEVSVVGRNLLQGSHPEFGNTTGPPIRIKRSAYVRLTWGR